MDPSELEKVRLWIAADELALADGATIVEWPDLSGSGNTLSNLTAAPKPVLKTNILNGLPVARFTSDVLREEAFSPAELEGAYIFMVYAVTENKGGFKRLLSFTPTNGSNDYEKGLAVDLGEKSKEVDDYLNIIGAKSAVENIDSKTSSNALGTFTRVTVDYFDDETTRLWVDGNAEGTRPADADKIGATQFRVGAGRYVATEQFGPSFDLAELIIVEEAVSEADRKGIEKYLYDKWGVGEPIEEEDLEDVRRFTAGDFLKCAPGDTGGATRPTTIAAILRMEEAPASDSIIWGTFDGTLAGSAIGVTGTGKLFYEAANDIAEHATALTFDNHWKLVLIDVSATGEVRFWVYDFTLEEWLVNGDSGGEVSVGAIEIDAVYFGRDPEGERDALNFDIAALGLWHRELSGPGSGAFAEVTGIRGWYAEIDAAWVTPGQPDALWLFHQDEASEEVSDDTGNGADQSEESGTAALNQDPPIPYGSFNNTIKAPAASVTFSMPEPTLFDATIEPNAASVTFSMPTPTIATGPTPSPTEQSGGLHLPFPSVLANANRLGPPRLTTLEKIRLGVKD